MIAETKLIYHCEHCNKISLRKSSMLQHEKSCKKNPNNIIMCFKCSFWSLLKEQRYISDTDRYGYVRENIFYFRLHFCKKYDVKMIPPKAAESEFWRNGLKDKYSKIMPTLSDCCSDFCKAEYVGRINDFRDYESYIELGRDCFTAMRYEEALSYFSCAIEHSEKPEALVLRGNVKSLLKDYAGAIEDYNEVIKLDKTKPDGALCFRGRDALFLRGNAKFLLEDYAGAIEDYNEVIKHYNEAQLDEKNRILYNACISACEMKTDFERATKMKKCLSHIEELPF